MFIPKVSVLMANYNGERFLASAIVSVLEQSYKNFELIVVDDGSTDFSPAILRAFVLQDPRVKAFYRSRNRGFACALNYGLARVRGEYVARMDSDDLCHRDRLLKQVSYLEKHPEIFVLGCRSVNIDEWGKRRNSGKDEVTFRRGRLLIARRMAEGEYLVVHASLVVRKFCFEEVGGYRELFPIGEDIDLYARLLERYGAIFENLPERLYSYRRYKESLTMIYSSEAHIKVQTLVMYSAFCRTQGMNDPLAKVKKLNFNRLPLSSNMRKNFENIVFLLSFSPTFCQDNRVSHLADIVRAERLLSNLPCILQDLPPSFFLYVKRSQPFIRLSRAWLGQGYWFKGSKCIALAFMTDPWASMNFFFKRLVFHSSRFVGRLFRVFS